MVSFRFLVLFIGKWGVATAFLFVIIIVSPKADFKSSVIVLTFCKQKPQKFIIVYYTAFETVIILNKGRKMTKKTSAKIVDKKFRE